MAHIVINDVTPVDTYTASGGAQVDFTVSYPFFTDASLQVFLTPVGQDPDDAADLLTLTTEYTVVGAGNVEGATKTVTLVSAATDGDVITIRRNEPTSRTSDLQDQGDFLAETHNDEQDKVIMLVQQLEEEIGRGITRGVTGGDWDAQSIAIKNVADPTDAQDAVTIAYAQANNVALFTSGSYLEKIDGDADFILTIAEGGGVVNIDRTTVAITATIPPNADVAFPIGTTITFTSEDNGVLTIARGAGVSLFLYDGINAPTDSNKTLSIGGVCSITKAETNKWIVFGNNGLAAV